MNIKIIDKFLSNEDFEELSNISLKKINLKEIKVYHNKISKDGLIEIAECLSNDLLKKLHKDYNDKALSILKDLSSKA